MPLHLDAASELPRPDMVELLMSHAADESLEEFETGFTARDLVIIMQKQRPGLCKEERARLFDIFNRKAAEEGVSSQASDAESGDDTDEDGDEDGEL
ncbi:hypothetical protein CHU98_g10012 [Xylaria longipes]|nr:hypothetical protein CHU98_g10012 [Xylaria longipes]